MNLGNVAKIDHLMSAQLDRPEPDGGTRFRYLLCSSARCGSNLVSDLLAQTGMAGVPMEYLNVRYIAGYQRATKVSTSASRVIDLGRYLAELERRRTTANGYWGIKVHFEHLRVLQNEGSVTTEQFLRRFDRIVLLRRRKKVAQAVSLYRARKTQIWSSLDRQFIAPDDPRLHTMVEFDAEAIAQALADSLHAELGWLHLLQRLELPFEEFWYEEWVSDYHDTGRRLLAALSLPDDLADDTSPLLEKQSANNDAMAIQFRQTIGDAAD